MTRAGVTKPSLYRSFPSKDELAAAYLRDHGAQRLKYFDDVMAEAPEDLRGQFRRWLEELVARARPSSTTAAAEILMRAVEYPDREHPGAQTGCGQ